MKYNNLKEWLERVVGYNLIEDTQSEQDNDYEMIESPYEKFFIYKYVNKSITKQSWDAVWKHIGEKGEEAKKEFEAKAKKYKSIKDPDRGSKLLQEVYKLLWKDLAEQSFMRQEIKENREEIAKIWEDGKKSASDAMTSVQEILKAALQNIISDKEETKPEDMSEEIFKHIQGLMKGAFKTNKEYWTILFCGVVAADLSEAELEREFYKLIDYHYPAMGEFINRCFTVGNYCPVPEGFNVPRAGVIYDYWDLTLMKIKDWYDKKDDRILKEQLFHNNKKGNLENCISWLEWFEKDENKIKKEYDGWHNFVDILLMQDYVDEKYEVKQFWKGHTWECPELPKDDKTIKDALEEINLRIAKRSIRIVLACMEKYLTEGLTQ